MRVLLIAVPSVRIRFNISGIYSLPPLGLAYIASALEKEQCSVEILDMPALRMPLERLPSFLKDRDYEVYGISCNILNLKNGIQVSHLIRALKPQAKIVLGGLCSTFPPELLFQYGPDFNMVVRGEGEATMSEVCQRLRTGASLEGVKGLSYKDKEEIISNPNREYIDINSFPFPARHLLPNKSYRLHPPFGIYSPVTLMETSRGCAYGCTFCTINRKRVRERSIDHTFAEIDELINKFKIKEIYFVDPNFTVNQERIRGLCERMLENNIKVAWTCKTRVDLVSDDLLRIMSEAGCYMICFGVESGSQDILNQLNKKISVENIKSAFSSSRKYKIRTLASLLISSPGETDSTVLDSIRLVKSIKADFVSYGELLPAPNSLLTIRAMKREQINCEDIAEFFINNKDIFQQRTITGHSRKDIERWLTKANRSFYCRVSWIMSRLLNIKNFRELFNLASGTFFLILDKMWLQRNNQKYGK